MTINDTVTFFGHEYTAVEYTGRPAEFMPSEDDPQCKICAIEPNYCKLRNECHGEAPFIFVKTEFVKMMDIARQFM